MNIENINPEELIKTLKDRLERTPSVIMQKDWYEPDNVALNRRLLHVFGDNTLRVGKGGQAIIRDCPNSFGICTKKYPGMEDVDFFSDSLTCFRYVIEDLYKLVDVINERGYNFIIFPYDGLGTGLSQMPSKAPNLYKFLNTVLVGVFGVHGEHYITKIQ